jgi:hypothetical protein
MKPSRSDSAAHNSRAATSRPGRAPVYYRKGAYNHEIRRWIPSLAPCGMGCSAPPWLLASGIVRFPISCCNLLHFLAVIRELGNFMSGASRICEIIYDNRALANDLLARILHANGRV